MHRAADEGTGRASASRRTAPSPSSPARWTTARGIGRAFAQVLHRSSACPSRSVRLVQGDTDRLIAGGGTGGSKSLMASGAAIVEAARHGDREGPRGRRATCWKPRSPTSSSSARESAASPSPAPTAASASWNSPAQLRDGRHRCRRTCPTASMSARLRPGAAWPIPNGCHVCEVEIDPETGHGADRPLHRRSTISACMVNPLLVAGQAHGGIVQGIGQALHERVAYSEDGQLLSGSYMDYGLPRADDLPDFGFESASRALHHQPARRQGLRRGRLRGLAAGGDERDGRMRWPSASATSTCRRRRRRSGARSTRHEAGAKSSPASGAPPAGQGAKPTRSRNSVNNHRFRATRRISAPSRGTGRRGAVAREIVSGRPGSAAVAIADAVWRRFGGGVIGAAVMADGGGNSPVRWPGLGARGHDLLTAPQRHVPLSWKRAKDAMVVLDWREIGRTGRPAATTSRLRLPVAGSRVADRIGAGRNGGAGPCGGRVAGADRLRPAQEGVGV